MSLEIVYGASRNRNQASRLADVISRHESEGTIYLGYPVLATADERVEVDALLVSPKRGLVAFLLADNQPTTEADWDAEIERQDRLYAVLESSLRRHDGLRKGRSLAVEIQTVTVFASPISDPPRPVEGYYCDLSTLEVVLQALPDADSTIFRRLQAALQRVTNIKPAKKRAAVRRPESRGAIMKIIERGIANLDRWQKTAAIETPEGPQRIRGLAGSGKTVVLALKAAYLHAQNPDWNIAVTYYSRALYQQIDDLVTRFSFEHSNDRPDPERLRIMHSWGSRSRPGVYSEIARALNVVPRDWGYANATYGMEKAFQGICQELLTVARATNPEPIFDAVLIDEAQDLPPEFFQLVYLFTKNPKRIVWGFDELQKLSESAMPDTDELFGKGEAGESLVNIVNKAGEPRRDIVLPVCYRNTPWALATAHALGIGVYRDEGLVQHFDDPNLWQEIGYNVLTGRLAPGLAVTLERSESSYPEYFNELLNPEDAVLLKAFKTEAEQDAWVAQQIKVNLTEDELEPDDILIVLPDTYRAKTRATRLISALRNHDVPAHLVGVNTSVDEVFIKDSVAIAHIYRAKGNEAPMVYVVDAHDAGSKFNQVTKRNTLFTGITRSRAWVRITGWAKGMPDVAGEVLKVKSSNYQLRFTIPTSDQIATLRRLNRGRSAEEEESVRKATEGLEAFIDAYDRQEVDLHDLPPALRTRLLNRLRADLPDDNI